MGEDLTFDLHNDEWRRSNCLARECLRKRRKQENSDADGNDLTRRMCQHLASFGDLSEDEHNDAGTAVAKNGNSLLNKAGLVIGGMAFSFSAALLVIAYTSAYCVIVGKDFTESTVGRYMYENSPYLDKAMRGPVEFLLQVCIFVALGFHVCCGWIGSSIGLVLHGLHFVFVDMVVLLYRSSVNCVTLGQCGSPFLLGSAWALLLVTTLSLLKAGMLFVHRMPAPLQQGFVEYKLGGVHECQQSRCAFFPSAAMKQMMTTIFCSLHSGQGKPQQGVGGSGGFSSSCGDVQVTANPPLDGEKANAEKPTAALAVEEYNKAQSSEYEYGFLNFLTRLFRSMFLSFLMRGVWQFMRQGRSAGRRKCSSKSKGTTAKQQKAEVELLARQLPQQEWEEMELPGHAHQDMPTPGEIPSNSQQYNTAPGDEQKDVANVLSSSGEGTDDGEEEWCFVSHNNPQTTPKAGS